MILNGDLGSHNSINQLRIILYAKNSSNKSLNRVLARILTKNLTSIYAKYKI